MSRVARRTLSIGALSAPFLVSLAAYIVAWWVMRPFPPTGDEPLYLLTGHSIAYDGDVELKNQLQIETSGRFYPHSLESMTDALVRPDGRVLPVHQLGLPLLIGAILGLGGDTLAVRLVIAVVASIAAHHVMAVLRDHFCLSPAWRWVVWSCYALLLPTVTHATQIYPEIIAACIVAVCASLLLRPRLGLGGYFVVGALCAVLPWLQIRYLSLYAAIGLAMVVRHAVEHRGATFARASWSWSRAGPACMGLTIAIVGLASSLLVQYGVYGSAWPGATYRSVASIERIDVPPVIYRLHVGAAGIFLDAQTGLLPYTPVYLLGLVGAGVSAARWPVPFGVVAVAGLGTLAIWSLPGAGPGGSLQGRYVVSILPLIAVGLAAFATLGRPARVIVAGLALYSACNAIVGLTDYWQLYPNPLRHNTLATIRPIDWVWPTVRQPTSSFLAPAATLPGLVGELNAEGDRVVGAGTPGVLSFGPYAPLNKGEYVALFVLAASGERGTPLARIEIGDSQELLAHRELGWDEFPSDGAFTQVSLPFRTEDTLRIEGRVLSYGGATLAVRLVAAIPVVEPPRRAYRDWPTVVLWTVGVAATMAWLYRHERERLARSSSHPGGRDEPT